MKTDVLVIGGGIVGVMTALYLAREGAGVVLVEAGDPNGAASGANSGSLHLQIPYPEFANLGEGWGRAFAPTLRLMSASLDLWAGIETELGTDLDVKRAGGLVVARTPAQMRVIAAKAALERDYGVETQLLDAGELRKLAPYLADDALGGGFCAAEGKANPLRATPALVGAAHRAGARILAHTPVLSLEAGAQGFLARTPRGEIRAARVVNAAGAAAAQIAAMLGVRVDLQGFPLQVTITEPLAGVIPHLVYSAAAKLSLKQAPNGGVIIGGGWPARVRPSGHLVTHPSSLAGNMATAVALVPALARARALRSWAAEVNGTADWRPIIGEAPGQPGFHLALFPWMGFTAGPMTARITADMVLGRAPTLPLKGISVLYD